MVTELKPCPFCNGQASLEEDSGITMIHCADDTCRVHIMVEEFVRQDAIDIWNQRARPEGAKHRLPIPLVVRPMLVAGQLATDEHGPLILINSEEEPPHEQVVTLFHEVLHMIGLTDEFLCDEYAMRLADAAPDMLRRLAHNINLPPYDRSATTPPHIAQPISPSGGNGQERAPQPRE